MRLCVQTATSEPVSVKKTPRRVHMWSHADWPSLKAKLQEFQAEFLATHTARTVEENYNTFKGKVQSLINSHIAIKMTSSRANMPWFNNTLKRMCQKKQRLFDKAKTSGTNKCWQQYRTFKRDTLKAIRRQRWKHMNNVLQVGLEQGDSKPFWRYVRAQRQDFSGVSPLLQI